VGLHAGSTRQDTGARSTRLAVIVGVSPVNQMAVSEYESLIVMQSLAQLAQGYLLPNLPRLA
jgi:hypothetical protein